MIDDICSTAKARMEKSVEALHNELGKLRTGRAHPALIENIMVPYYGNDTPLNQVATIAVGDPRTLLVTPWEKDMVAPIEKAIMSSDLGLNPASVGTLIRVPLPPLTEERRKDLIKMVRQCGENAKISVRNIRRDANQQIKDLLKEKAISEDDERRAEDSTQKLTNQFTGEIDKVLAAKEADLMEI